MGIRERYENGVFSWTDLVTTDQEAAKAFYSQLFSWTFVDKPVEGMPPYCMAFKTDRTVAALFLMPPDQREQNIPPHWQSYINVTDLDATLVSWKEHGGNVLSAAFDVMDAGRMAVVKDPTDAVVNLWQAKAHIGAELVNEVNTFCWAELQGRGIDRAVQFYQAVFDWDVEIDDKPPNYVTGLVQGHYNCGMFDMDKVKLPADVPVRWAVYFNVENLDDSMETVRQLGGKTLTDAIVIDPGRFATVSDPQGAVFTIMEIKEPDD